MNTPYIYKITNLITGSSYIGKHNGKDNDYFTSGKLIKEVVAKYGIQNFKREILEYIQDMDIINEREKYWIQYYNTYKGKGYNLTPGGDGGILGLKRSEDTKKKIGMKNSGPNPNKKRSDEFKQKISNALKGRIQSDKSKQLISKALTNKLKSEEHKQALRKPKSIKHQHSKEHIDKRTKVLRKQVAQYTLDDKLIKIYLSITEASLLTSSNISDISNCCQGKQKTSKGYKWKYHNE
jgi:group I intron endonuclease